MAGHLAGRADKESQQLATQGQVSQVLFLRTDVGELHTLLIRHDEGLTSRFVAFESRVSEREQVLLITHN